LNKKDAAGLVSEIEAAWNSHDMRSFAARFAADADFVNVAGAWWRGRTEIEEKHAARHADMFKNSTIKLQLAALREITPGIGVMHVTWQLEGHAESGPRRTTNTRYGIWSWTVREHNGKLEIVSSHNTDVIAAPPASAGATREPS
jgi:uncharacterized protein (TIGR02246 family)